MGLCYSHNQKKTRGDDQEQRGYCGRQRRPRPGATGRATCVDDDADHGLRVPDGAASEQQVFLVQPGLLPVVVRAVGGIGHASPRRLHAPHIPGSRDAGQGGGTGTPERQSPQWILQELDGACAYWQLGF